MFFCNHSNNGIIGGAIKEGICKKCGLNFNVDISNSIKALKDDEDTKLNIYQDLFISRMDTFNKELVTLSGVDVNKIYCIPSTFSIFEFIKFRAILEYLIYIDSKESSLSVLFNRLFNDETAFNKQFEYDIKDICEKMRNGKIISDLELLNRISAAVEESSNTSNDVEVAAFDELQSNISDDEFGVDVEQESSWKNLKNVRKEKYISNITFDKTQYIVRINDNNNFKPYLHYIGKSNKPTQPIGLTDYRFMFSHRHDLETLDLSDWDMSEAEVLACMFLGCKKLKRIIGIEEWNISNVKNFNNMLYNCEGLHNSALLFKWGLTSLYIRYSNLFKCFPCEVNTAVYYRL